MQLPKPDGKNLNEIIGEIKAGRMLIPQFQRIFVWSMEEAAKLIDSILKGYPIGACIFWQTSRERLRPVRSIGGQPFPEPKNDGVVNFVLDGQQRLTSLYACLEGCEIQREGGKIDDFKDIVIDLAASENDPLVRTDTPEQGDRYIPVHRLHEGRLSLLNKFPNEFHDKLDQYRDIIRDYRYSVIQLPDVPLDVATEVFTRVNTRGKPLGLFEIMVAKTYDGIAGFDLLEKWEEFRNSLGSANYETVAPVTALRTVAIIADKDCTKKNILNMDKKKFISHWDKAKDSVERAVDHLRSTGLAPVSRLLPYDSLIVSFAYFFSQQGMASPRQTELLEDFFWRVAFTSRYSSSVESKLVEDIGYMKSFWGEEKADYGPGWGVNISPDYIINNGGFATGRAYIKAILCLYASQKPRSFNNHSREVIIDNSWLKQSNSKNYHHFFPKGFLKTQGKQDESGHVLNITIVDDFLNKREIGAKPPSVYMKKFGQQNASLDETMQTHLISDIDGFGVLEDDYGKFLKQRAKAVSKELSKRVIQNRMDGERQPNLDDYEENAE